VEVSNNTMK